MQASNPISPSSSALNTPPEIAADPAVAALQTQILQAAKSGCKLRIRGAGSKDFYGAVDNSAEVLDSRALSGIVSYEPSELVVTVRAGTPLAELEVLLAQRGQCLAFEPPHFGGATIAATIGGDDVSCATVGGAVAAGISGPARASVGGVRDYVLGAQFINGRGEHLQFGGTVIKNVAGYDVSRVLAGSLGQLGVITELSLKVLPVAPAEATLQFQMDEATAIQQLNAWGGLPLPLNASNWVDEAGGTLFLRLRGAVAAVEEACAYFLKDYAAQGASRLDNAAVAGDWLAARELTLPWFDASAQLAKGCDLWRVSVPSATPPLQFNARRTSQDGAGLASPATNTEVAAPLIDWHGAQRWYWLPRDPALIAAVHAVATAAGGHAALFRPNPNLAKLPPTLPRSTPLSPVLQTLNQNLKAAFDPMGVFVGRGMGL